MTFFANSGITWPQHEEATRQAGGDTFEAVSDLWKIFATIERANQDNPPTVDRAMLNKCAENLVKASSAYRTIASQIGKRVSLGSLTSMEFELAALHPYGYRRQDNGPLSKWLFNSYDTIIDLYNELSQRLEILASAVRAFEPNRQKSDLAAQVFQIMKHWEAAAPLGRVIAVLNRREQTDNR